MKNKGLLKFLVLFVIVFILTGCVQKTSIDESEGAVADAEKEDGPFRIAFIYICLLYTSRCV